MWKISLLLLNLFACAACQTSAVSFSTEISAGVLSAEYQQSSANTRRKYDGKELVVRGYTETAAKLPESGDNQGSISLRDKAINSAPEVTCWFSKEQTQEFSRVKGGQYVTVKGVFNGEGGADLKFCKLVKIE